MQVNSCRCLVGIFATLDNKQHLLCVAPETVTSWVNIYIMNIIDLFITMHTSRYLLEIFFLCVHHLLYGHTPRLVTRGGSDALMSWRELFHLVLHQLFVLVEEYRIKTVQIIVKPSELCLNE